MRGPRSIIGTLVGAVSTGFSVAFVVALLQLVDSNHQKPFSLVLTQIGATFFWVTVIAAVWLFWRRRSLGD
jgi:hypothetical protein